MTQESASLIELLNALQAIDSELDKLQFDEKQIPVDLASARAEDTRLEIAIKKGKEDLFLVQRELKTNDIELSDLTSKREKARQEQKTTQNSKEQTQYENLIQQLSGRIDELEEASFPLLDKIEVLKGEITSAEEQKAVLIPKLTELESIDEERIESIRSEAVAKQQERETLADTIDPKTLKDYEAIRRSGKSIALSQLKGGRCGGCNVSLPLNVQQKVKNNQVIKCPSCGRILWTE